MKNGQKDPDWGKFGLDNEKQPLKPAGNLSGQSSVPGASMKGLQPGQQGGQIQNDNELFADDQVNCLLTFINIISNVFC